MLVYRDGRKRVRADDLVRQLERALASLETQHASDLVLDALLRAGELECALADADSGDHERAVAVTDELAGFACRPETLDRVSVQGCQRVVGSINHDGELTLSRPEGFAYYALHPLDFADALSNVRLSASRAYVVGIRSIGTTLSAVVAAKLNADGIVAARTTVRPHGHPYHRHTTFSATQGTAIGQALSHAAVFLVCDEGPGRSGSSLLSVAEALEREGVGRDRILLLSSHEPDVDALCSPDAPERWRRYRSVASGMTKRLPHGAARYLSTEEWRGLISADRASWPASWPQMERVKYLSRDGRLLFQFEGHGPYGEVVRRRSLSLAAGGFGPAYVGDDSGFGLQELVIGRQVNPHKLTSTFLSHVARYCAWRVASFPATVTQEEARQLVHMAEHNLEQEFGVAPELQLQVERPVVCDAQMHPFYWRELAEGGWIKLEASTHGDDHFFPGPTDVAWDLAGFCVEWNLDDKSREFFLSEYQRLSGDNARPRLPQFEVAYSAFRLGWSRMASASTFDADNERRLSQNAGRYRAVLDRTLLANTFSI